MPKYGGTTQPSVIFFSRTLTYFFLILFFITYVTPEINIILSKKYVSSFVGYCLVVGRTTERKWHLVYLFNCGVLDLLFCLLKQ